MTEQQYRVIADATMKDLRTGDLAVVRVAEGFEDGAWSAEPGIIRIERPVPTTDEPNLTDRLAELQRPVNGHRPYCLSNQPGDGACNCDMDQHPHPPTREQIAGAIEAAFSQVNTERFHESVASMASIVEVTGRYERAVKDAVLALIQNGADR